MRRLGLRMVVLGALVGLLPVSASWGQDADVEVPDPVLTEVAFSVTVAGDSSLGARPVVQIDGDRYPMTYEAEKGAWTAEEVTVAGSGRATVEVVANDTTVRTAETRAMPGWLSLLPPLIAIGLALLYRRVVPALFVGVWMGAVLAIGLTPWGVVKGLLDTMQVYVLEALADESHAAIILFSLMIGGMVGIISRNGGTLGIVERISGWASTSRRGQLATWALGLAVFFDDYANTLIVGNTMRPVTDRLQISREKLAYIVDSTAAPISCLAFVTTWIGYEVGLVGTAIAGIEGFDQGAYAVFLHSLPYSFYPLLALFFVFVVAYSQRDFGPMYAAERRARETGQVLDEEAQVDEAAAGKDALTPPSGIPHRALNAVLPIVVLVGTVLGGLYATGVEGAGTEASLREVIGAADSYAALLWGSLMGVLVAGGLSVGQGLLDLEQTVEAWYDGLKSMLFAMVILVLAWALSNITEVLHTADYLVSVLGAWMPAGGVPALIFVLAAATAFATGSSWGTMGILMPLVVPLAWAVLVQNGMDEPAHYHILYSAVSCVLAGAVWGDHCSPISDTTILSSMASGCDHISHVRTQLPYALTVGLVALLVGTLPTGFGVPWWGTLPVAAALLAAIHWGTGRSITHAAPAFREDS